MKVKIIADFTQINNRLKTMEKGANNLTPVLNDIGNAVKSSHSDRWDKMISPEGKQWKPLSRNYKKWKAENYPAVANKILVLHGNLRNLKMNVGSDSVSIGTSIPYGKKHQYGDSNTNLPIRKFLGFSPQDRKTAIELVEKAFHDYVS